MDGNDARYREEEFIKRLSCQANFINILVATLQYRVQGLMYLIDLKSSIVSKFPH